MSKSSEFNQENMTSTEASVQKQIPVPKAMKTKTLLPRIIALAVSLVSLLIFAVGSKTLASRQQQDSTPVDQLLIEGTAYWGFFPSGNDEKRCLAVITSTLHQLSEEERKAFPPETPPPAFRFTGHMNFRFLTLNQSLLSRATLHLRFSDLFQLSEIRSRVTFSGGELSLHTIPRSDKQEETPKEPENFLKAILKIHAGKHSRSVAVNIPNAIYLVERSDRRFSLHLPPQLGGLMGDIAKLNNSEINVSLEKLESEKSYQRCLAEVKNNEITDVPFGIDLGRMVSTAQQLSAK